MILKNVDIVKNILATFTLTAESPWQLTKIEGPKKDFTYGNKLIALGATDSGLEYYSAYPMTPASTVLTEIIATGKVTYLQAEDEIAVINSALGAAFT